MKYIEADFIERKLKWYCKTCDSYHGVKCGTCEISDCLDLIDEAPTIVNLTVQLNNIAKPSEKVVIAKMETTTGGAE